MLEAAPPVPDRTRRRTGRRAGPGNREDRAGAGGSDRGGDRHFEAACDAGPVEGFVHHKGGGARRCRVRDVGLFGREIAPREDAKGVSRGVSQYDVGGGGDGDHCVGGLRNPAVLDAVRLAVVLYANGVSDQGVCIAGSENGRRWVLNGVVWWFVIKLKPLVDVA